MLTASASPIRFMYLHRNFNYKSKFISILVKVCVSQAVFTPIFNTYFFTAQSLLSGTSFPETWELVKKAVPTSILNSVKLWPAVTAFMFMYIEPQFRYLFSGGIAVGWQTYLSWLNQKAKKEIADSEEESSLSEEKRNRFSQSLRVAGNTSNKEAGFTTHASPSSGAGTALVQQNS